MIDWRLYLYVCLFLQIKEFVEQGVGNKNLEAQCGYVTAFAHLCERCVALSKRAKFGGKGFSPAGWEPYQEGAVCLGKCKKLFSFRFGAAGRVRT